MDVFGKSYESYYFPGFAQKMEELPDLQRYDVRHSYILELKYLSSKDTDAKAETQWREAVEQIKGYAAAPKVRQLVQGTELHCIVMQFRGWELERLSEID